MYGLLEKQLSFLLCDSLPNTNEFGHDCYVLCVNQPSQVLTSCSVPLDQRLVSFTGRKKFYLHGTGIRFMVISLDILPMLLHLSSLSRPVDFL